MKKHVLVLFASLLICSFGNSQNVVTDSCEIINETLDSIYIAETENVKGSEKVLHAEPLFIDLIRDLGARKGEKEWNVGLGMIDKEKYDTYLALVEYEFAPIDRLGFEVELPFSFHLPIDSGVKKTDIPGNKLHSIKLATQFSFYVSEKRSLSTAIGYIHEFEQTTFNKYGKESLFKGNIFNPFFVAAKRWGGNFHTLLYTGPVIEKKFNTPYYHTTFQVNTNFHYMITGTRNFIGVEFNKDFHKTDFDMTIRPQMRVGLADNLMVGVITGIPIKRESERLSMFIRLIYEPKHKQKKLC